MRLSLRHAAAGSRDRAHVCEVTVHFVELLALPVQLLEGVCRKLPGLICGLHTARAWFSAGAEADQYAA